MTDEEQLPPGSPAELTEIQDVIDEWVERGVVIERSMSRGSKQPGKVVYRVAHPWELEPPALGSRKHIHDWRWDLTQQEEDEGLIYCGGCGKEMTVSHEDFADPRVIRHAGDGLPNVEQTR